MLAPDIYSIPRRKKFVTEHRDFVYFRMFDVCLTSFISTMKILSMLLFNTYIGGTSLFYAFHIKRCLVAFTSLF